MKIKQRIDNYLKNQNYTEKDIELLNSSSVYLAWQISAFAHNGQKRVNGNDYFTHPCNVLQGYRNFVGITNNGSGVDIDLLVGEFGIPYHGVQEVCLLHDVLEDTSVTLEEIEEVFEEFDLDYYFESYIKTPLLLVTHDKSEDYAIYIAKLINNPVASIVKFMDLVDNMNASTLTTFGDKELSRINDYAFYCKCLNDRWRFTEKVYEYKKAKLT